MALTKKHKEEIKKLMIHELNGIDFFKEESGGQKPDKLVILEIIRSKMSGAPSEFLKKQDKFLSGYKNISGDTNLYSFVGKFIRDLQRFADYIKVNYQAFEEIKSYMMEVLDECILDLTPKNKNKYKSKKFSDLIPSPEGNKIFSNQNALIEAINQGDINTALNLINGGAVDVNFVGRRLDFADKDLEYTVLQWASKRGRVEIVKALIGAGADVNKRVDISSGSITPGPTALWLAVNGYYYGRYYDRYYDSRDKLPYLEIINILVKEGANVNLEWEGVTPLHIAANTRNESDKCLEIVNILINAGANVNGAERNDSNAVHNTVLSKCAQYGRNEMIELLLKLGADVKFKDRDGKSALYYAIEGGRTKSALTLMSAGAVYDLKAFFRAVWKENPEIAKATIAAAVNPFIGEGGATLVAMVVANSSSFVCANHREATEHARDFYYKRVRPIQMELFMVAAVCAITTNEVFPGEFMHLASSAIAAVSLENIAKSAAVAGVGCVVFNYANRALGKEIKRAYPIQTDLLMCSAVAAVCAITTNVMFPGEFMHLASSAIAAMTRENIAKTAAVAGLGCVVFYCANRAFGREIPQRGMESFRSAY